MVGRLLLSRADPGFTLPAFERLAPPPTRELVDARLEANSAPGDIVADLFGRGGWIARASIDRQRRAFTIESSPLTRLLAEVVLRPPDLRHLDAAFQALSASGYRDSSLRLAIADMFGTKCVTCGRNLAIDEAAWRGETLERIQYRCTLCRDQQGRSERQIVEPGAADRERATRDVGAAEVRRRLRDRFPVPDGGEHLVDAILDLHTDRQLVGLGAILARIEGDLRAAAVESALRLAFLHAVLPASRLGLGGPRIPSIRIAGGTIRSALPDPWRERNPWLAFEDGFRLVRSFVQRLESGALGPMDARFGSDLRSLVEGSPNAVVRVMTPGSLSNLAGEPVGPRIRLVLGQPPARFSQERLGAAYHGTAWALGREAAALLPLEALLGSAVRAPWSWQAAMLRRSLEAVAPHLAHEARVILLLDHGGPEALVAAVLGGVGAGYRLVEARLADADEDIGGVVELVPPGGVLPPGPRTRSNVQIAPLPGGRGDPDLVPGPGLFAPPERIEARPFSAREAATTVSETAIELLKARGEPARYERLLGEILVGLDRTGQLRRLVAAEPQPDPLARIPPDDAPPPDPTAGFGAAPGMLGSAARVIAAGAGSGAATPPATRTRTFTEPPQPHDPVDRVLALIGSELGRESQHRLVEIEPGRWWLGDRYDRDDAAVPLADRVEWAVYSLLSTAGPIAESAFFERVAALFPGHDLPDETLVRACLASYRSPASTASRLVTAEDLRGRTAEHTELLAHLANGGHRLGMRVWIGRRDQARRIGDRQLADFLDPREREPWFPTISLVPKDDGEAVDCIWYQRGGTAYLFEVEWTAMLGDVLLRRHGRIPPDDRMVRFLAIAPERRELARHKLEASPILREAIAASNWHLILWPQLRAWLARDPLSLADLEPYLGLEPPSERRAEQLGLFEG
ncbi:MAG TPA: hypothetical protein VE011_00220 [Candidatus Dormibacteraeota bacterium]|nr:hypothetical protein [Candidatus Dormibacteraeota bacterium]